MKKDLSTQPEYLIESDYFIFHRITRFVYQTWIAFSILVVVLGSYDYTGAGIISTLLLKFSEWISHAVPLIDKIAVVRPQSDATRVILSVVIFLLPFEIVRIVRMMRRAADGAKNKTLLMKKLCGDKKDLIRCSLYVIYRVSLFTIILSVLIIAVIYRFADDNGGSFWNHAFNFIIRSSLGVELAISTIVVAVIHLGSSGYVALSYLLNEQFHSQKGK